MRRRPGTWVSRSRSWSRAEGSGGPGRDRGRPRRTAPVRRAGRHRALGYRPRSVVALSPLDGDHQRGRSEVDRVLAAWPGTAAAVARSTTGPARGHLAHWSRRTTGGPAPIEVAHHDPPVVPRMSGITATPLSRRTASASRVVARDAVSATTVAWMDPALARVILVLQAGADEDDGKLAEDGVLIHGLRTGRPATESCLGRGPARLHHRRALGSGTDARDRRPGHDIGRRRRQAPRPGRVHCPKPWTTTRAPSSVSRRWAATASTACSARRRPLALAPRAAMAAASRHHGETVWPRCME